MSFTNKILVLTLLATSSGFLFAADSAPSIDKSAAGKQAIATRKAAYTLIGNSFKPIGDVSKGTLEYNQADIEKRAKRILMLTEFLDGAFPEASNLGEPATKAKAEIWTQRADFDKRLKDFQEHAALLVQVTTKEKSASDAFKDATTLLAKDCKGCHENFKVK